MAWIESNQEIARHPKTKKLARKLGVTVPAAIGYLHLLWWWALDFAQDGDLSKYEPDDIADACLWDGEAESFISGLTDSEWLDVIEGRLKLHDWYDYAGRLLDKRAEDAERKRKSRRPKDVQRTSDGQIQDGARNSTVPNHTVPNSTEPDNTDPEQKRSADTHEVDPTYPNHLESASGAPAYTETILDVHQKVFGTFSMTGLMSDFINKLLEKGMTEEAIKELLLEAGESANGKPSLRLLEPIAERWIAEGIKTREESKRKRRKQRDIKGNSGKPVIPIVSENSFQPQEIQSKEERRKLLDRALKLDNKPPLTDSEFEKIWEEYERKWRGDKAG